MTKYYHDQRTLREILFRPLYRLPILPIPLERFLALKLLPFLIGKPDHNLHAGSDCPCMNENIDIGENEV